MSILQNKVLISIKSGNGERRFYNRITQGFTCRWDGSRFSDSDNVINPYFNTFNQHSPSLNMWQALCDNDDHLIYRKFTFSHLIKGNVT